MNSNAEWLKFIISGSVKHYINYKTEAEKQQFFGGVKNTDFDRRSCNQGDLIQRERPHNNNNNT